ncbi:MAG: AI-2E family transporter [Anaerolineales bacterium]|nr:AI-2E family transporter [Anaerolineales bacterium]MCS7249014.1 AI-2E family transporter [Anaerolineales bacterium]MDW8162827.1 AI-2E family transporter [Anaerolineales bacterium]MDW8445889.1 AI-2E family transporter [Anaerolineales bacterium]
MSPLSEPGPSASPKWGPTTKLIVGLSFVGLLVLLVIQFRHLVGPLILAFMLAYLLYPVAERLSYALKIPWQTAVVLIYTVLSLILIGLITLSGLAIVQQLQSLFSFLQNSLKNFPQFLEQISRQTFVFGPFQFSLAQYDLPALANQALAIIQPLLGRAGSLIGSIAASAATTLLWGLFVLIVSYFLLADAGKRVRHEFVHIEIPGYQADLERFGTELRRIWNDFLRGQLIVISLAVLAYFVLLTVLGVRYAVGIAVLAGVGRLVPYIGPWALWITTFLVTYFQTGNYFGLQPIQYSALVLVLAFLTDQVFDHIVSPRFMGETLGVHPAAVLVAAIVFANLIGLIGLVFAAPVVATLKLVATYVVRKMLDLDPWPPEQRLTSPKPANALAEWSKKALSFLKKALLRAK